MSGDYFDWSTQEAWAPGAWLPDTWLAGAFGPDVWLTASGGGGGAYAAKAVHFNGIVSLSGPVSIADSPLLSFAFLVKVSSVVANHNPWMFGTTGFPWRSYMNIGTNNYSIGNDNYDADGNNEDCFDTIHDVFSADQWIWIASCMDMNHAVNEKINFMVIGDTVFTDNQCGDFSTGPFDIAFGPLLELGRAFNSPHGTTQGGLFGDISDVWIAPGQFVDFSQQSIRRKFIDANGKPVFLGANGELPTGTSPSIFLSGDASSTGFVKNKGSAGDVLTSITGAVNTSGNNGAGACPITLTDTVQAGWTVSSVIDLNTGADLSSSFESVISLDGQIQQTSSDDLSNTSIFITLPDGGVLTNATTSPSD
jgi:hypothetical protein